MPKLLRLALAVTLAVTAAVLLALGSAPMLCTSAVASGLVTEDGRPLLWKNRDTGNRDNEIVHFAATESAHAFVAVCNAGQTSS
ncbi:MAG: hypothetical protein KDB18_07300, partial [Salinibacterium sp.]|nr:hypothetical protein [Salinibacterium sp.]